MTVTCTRSPAPSLAREQSRPCRCTAPIVPRTVPVTFERPARSWYSTGTSRIRHPAPWCAQHHLERPAGSAVAQAERRAAARDVRRASGRGRSSREAGAPTHLDRQHPVGELGRAAARRPGAAMRAPITRSASSRSHVPGDATATPTGSSEASQSMKHTTSSVAACSPAQHAAPNPRTGSCTTRRARGRRRSLRCRRSSRCRRRWGG